MIIWVIGLSGAGKTTIGQALYQRIKSRHPQTVFLDGDIFRRVMGGDLGFSAQDREKSCWRYHYFCQMLDSQGINVVCCVLSNQPDIQAKNRETFKSYFEIYIDVTMDTLIQRDPEGLYQSCLKGETTNVVGIDIPFTPPANPDMVIDNNTFVDLPSVISAINDRIERVPEEEESRREKV